MNLTWFLISVVVAVFVSSLTDWFFSGVLFASKYAVYPQTWRGAPGEPETNRILASTALSVVTCAVFIALAIRLGLTTPASASKLVVAVWLIGPLPLIFTNAVWIKMHWLTAVAHSLGWLAKLIICGACAVHVYRGH